MKKNEIRKAESFDELLDIKYGKVGTKKRDSFEERAQYFVYQRNAERSKA